MFVCTNDPELLPLTQCASGSFRLHAYWFCRQWFTDVNNRRILQEVIFTQCVFEQIEQSVSTSEVRAVEITDFEIVIFQSDMFF